MVWIGASEVRLHRRAARGGAAAVAAKACEPGAQAEALRELLSHAARPLRLQGLLSSRLLRFAALRGTQALRDATEREAAARLALQDAHGACEGWQVAWARPARHGATLVAAVDAALAAPLQAAVAAGPHRWHSLQPWASHALRRARRQLRPQHGWLAVAEPDRALLLRLDAEGIEAVHSHRLAPADGQTLAGLLSRQRLLDGRDLGPSDALLAGAAQDIDTQGFGADWRVTLAPVPLQPAATCGAWLPRVRPLPGQGVRMGNAAATDAAGAADARSLPR